MCVYVHVCVFTCVYVCTRGAARGFAAAGLGWWPLGSAGGCGARDVPPTVPVRPRSPTCPHPAAIWCWGRSGGGRRCSAARAAGGARCGLRCGSAGWGCCQPAPSCVSIHIPLRGDSVVCCAVASASRLGNSWRG